MEKIFLLIVSFFLLLSLSACGAAKTAVTPPPAKPGLTMAVVAEHNTPDDCWLVINNNIYNFTDYIANHPGGEKNITDYCGQDATAAFDTKGGSGEAHSDKARQLLAQFYIGDLAR
jgi:cytochrome b involved in lipid metabolism